MSGLPSDYYAILDVKPDATHQQIRDAYKRAALKTHPDRVPSDSPERSSRTKKFQQVNDAYYTLSDPTRRKDYDAARIFHGFGTGASSPSSSNYNQENPFSNGNAAPEAGPGFSFPWSSFGFGAKTSDPKEKQRYEDEQFGDAFEEMLREEGMAENGGRPTGKFWSLLGGLSGAAMGFIMANFPGMLAGAAAGGKLGSIRDARGMSVYAVFQEMDQGTRMQLLSSLAAKVFAHVATS